MGVRRGLRIRWRRLKQSPYTPDRKQTLTFVLVTLPVGLYWWFGDHWAIAVLTPFIGVLLSTDYQVVDEYISSTLYEWIQDTETLLDAVEQNYYAARYAHEGYEPIELTYWKNGHFRATVPADRPIHPGTRFLIRCTVDAQDNEFSYPLPFCTAEVESVSPESDGKHEMKMDLVRWLNDNYSQNEPDRTVYREKTRQLREGSNAISPTADINESAEMDALTPDEWGTLAELLERTEIHERR